MLNPLKQLHAQQQKDLQIKSIEPLNYSICPECDWITAKTINNKAITNCPHCLHSAKPKNMVNSKALTYSVCGLFLLIFSFFTPFLTINIKGIVNKISLFEILTMLYTERELFLTLLLLCLVFLFPLILMLIQIFMLLPFFLSKKIRRFLLIVYFQLKEWTLPEIFMAGVCVSFIKLISYGEISFFIGFWTFCFYIFVYIKATIYFPNQKLWNQVAPQCYLSKEVNVNQSALSQNIRLCDCCGAILNATQSDCLRCGVAGEKRKKFSLQLTVAFLISATILYLPANILSIMQTMFLGSSSGSTILDGVIYMWGEKDYPVALIIFCASILIPVLKITGLSFLCHFCHKKKPETIEVCQKWTKIYNAIEIIGKWSMVDVFVVIVLSSLIQNGRLISVLPDIGVYFFASVVIITMIASKKFDPRLIWDRKLIQSIHLTNSRNDS